MASITIRTVDAILPCLDPYAERIDAYGAEKTVFAASSEQASELYAMLYRNEQGQACALFVELNEKALKIMRYYNASAVSARKV